VFSTRDRKKEEDLMEVSTNPQSQNSLLAALSNSAYRSLLPSLTEVSLPHGEILYDPGGPIDHVYFPLNSLVSLVTIMQTGASVEVGLVGSDGMVGIAALMGEPISLDQVIVQIADGAMKAKLSVIKDLFLRGGEFQDLLLRYTRAHLRQVAQTAACNATHSVEERLARWLLMCRERVHSEQLALTQEFIADMLGTRRATVSAAASALQTEGLIQYHRGHIRIVDQKSLEEFACECYEVVRTEFERLLGPNARS
jgi:CRP-like cAMP-binding protein